MPLFFYGMFSVFSGQIFYNSWIYQLFNLLFASLPIVYYAVMDREMPIEELMANPKHYILGIKGLLFSTHKFWQWIFEACLQAMIILLVSLFSLCYTTGRKHYGQVDPMSVAAVMVFGMVVVFVNVKVFLFSYSHSIFSLTINVFSILLYYLVSALITDWFPIYETLDNFDSLKATYMMFSNPNAYLAFLVMIFSGFFLQPLLSFYYVSLKRVWQKNQEPHKRHGLQEIGLSTAINEGQQEEDEEDHEGEDFDDVPAREEPIHVAQGRIRRRNWYLDTGFAFSGESGHAPQLTDPQMFKFVHGHSMAQKD